MPPAPPPTDGLPSGAPPVTPFVRPLRRDEAPLPLPTDDEHPPETIDVLGRARLALMMRVGTVFLNATDVVTALLRVVQSAANPDAPDTRETSGEPPPHARSLRDNVGAVLREHATTDAEQEGTSPAFVDEVAGIVQSIARAESRFPGALSVLQERTVGSSPPAAPAGGAPPSEGGVAETEPPTQDGLAPVIL